MVNFVRYTQNTIIILVITTILLKFVHFSIAYLNLNFTYYSLLFLTIVLFYPWDSIHSISLNLV